MDNKETKAKPPESMQDQYVGQLIKDQVPVSVYLVNGIRLVGILIRHDRYTLLVKGRVGAQTQLVYKAAVSTVLPVQATGADSEHLSQSSHRPR